MAKELLLRAWDEITQTMVYSESVYLNAPITNKTIISYYSNPMRSIGLKDKNGALIYEDDLVKLPDNRICVIEDCGYMIAPFHPGSPCDTTVLPEYVEVVGNIFENPDLFLPIKLKREEYEKRQSQIKKDQTFLETANCDELPF